MTAFHDVRFPEEISRGSSYEPNFTTGLKTTESKGESRSGRWEQARRRYDAGIGICNLRDLYETLEFYHNRLGRAHSFRFKDWSDYRSRGPEDDVLPTDQVLGTGDGSATTFQLRKGYFDLGTDQYVHWRPITKPLPDTVRVAVDGTELTAGQFSVSRNTGEITLSTAPANGAEVTAGFEFDVPVRFDSDAIGWGVVAFEIGQIPEIPLVEVDDPIPPPSGAVVLIDMVVMNQEPQNDEILAVAAPDAFLDNMSRPSTTFFLATDTLTVRQSDGTSNGSALPVISGVTARILATDALPSNGFGDEGDVAVEEFSDRGFRKSKGEWSALSIHGRVAVAALKAEALSGSSNVIVIGFDQTGVRATLSLTASEVATKWGDGSLITDLGAVQSVTPGGSGGDVDAALAAAETQITTALSGAGDVLVVGEVNPQTPTPSVVSSLQGAGATIKAVAPELPGTHPWASMDADGTVTPLQPATAP